ncbi:MAG: amidohydrolase family protein [Planctomycetota bacterium]
MKRKDCARAGRSGLVAVSALLLIGAIALTPTASAQSSALAIENATIVPGPGQKIEGGTVVMRDGLITAVGKGIEIPFDAEVVDGEGLTVYAGFIDGSASIGLADVQYSAGPAASEDIDFRTTSLASTRPANRKDTHPDLQVANFFNPVEKDAAALRKQGFTAALLTPPRAILGGQSALIALGPETRRSSVIAAPISMHGSLRASRGDYPSTLMGAMAHLRQVLLDAQHHRRRIDGAEQHGRAWPRPPYDPALEALFPVLDGSLPLTFAVSSDLDAGRVLGLAREFGFHPAIEGGSEAWKIADRLAAQNAFVVLHLDFPDEPEVPGEKEESAPEKSDAPKPETAPEKSDAPKPETAPEKADADQPDEGRDLVDSPKEESQDESKSDAKKAGKKPSRFEEPRRWKEDEHRRWLERVNGAKRLGEAGVTYAISSNGAGDKFHENLARAIGEGLSTDQALAAMTTVPARRFGVEDRLGTVAVGKAANLTLLNEPLGTEKNSVAYVFVDGRKFEVAGKKKDTGQKSGGDAKQTGIAGKWSVSVSSDEGDQEVTWDLQMNEGALTGSMDSDMGSLPLDSGSLQGTDLELVFTIEFGNESFELKFVGQLAGDSASGSLESPMGEATWTAKRTPNGGGER